MCFTVTNGADHTNKKVCSMATQVREVIIEYSRQVIH